MKLLADISSYQTVQDWRAYGAFARQGDNIARVLMRSSQGVGVADTKFEQFWSGALANGMDCIGIYHFAYPNLHPGSTGAAAEAQYFASVVGGRLRPDDFVMLDLEQFESAAWAHAFHDALPAALLQNKPVLYDSASHFQQFFAADLTLAAKYDCALAAWYPVAQGPPAAPQGWVMRWWQWTDNKAPRPIMTVPGISMPVDVNLWLGGASMVPTGPFVFPKVGREIPAGTTLQQIADGFGLPLPDLLSLNPWANGYNPTQAGVIDGDEVKLPGYPQPATQPPGDPLADAAKAAIKAWLAS